VVVLAKAVNAVGVVVLAKAVNAVGMLKQFFPGEYGVGPKGLFRIPKA